MRKVILALAVLVVIAFATAAPAMATEPRCCVPKTGGSGGHGLPFTGLPLYVPVLLSLGAIGAGIALRRRTREQV